MCLGMICDSFVICLIKHDQLNIFAPNVCHKAPELQKASVLMCKGNQWCQEKVTNTARVYRDCESTMSPCTPYSLLNFDSF